MIQALERALVMRTDLPYALVLKEQTNEHVIHVQSLGMTLLPRTPTSSTTMFNVAIAGSGILERSCERIFARLDSS